MVRKDIWNDSLMANEPAKSESPDEFLKRNGIAGYDPELVNKPTRPTIDRSRIRAILQPKEDGSSCEDCNNT